MVQEIKEHQDADNNEYGKKELSRIEKNVSEYSSIQPISDGNIFCRDLKPETIEKLKADPKTADGNSILNDETGKSAEKYVSVVLKEEGLPNGNSRKELKNIVPGTFDGTHGIDLIAIEADGKPNIIEVKKRKELDVLGSPRAEWNDLESETKAQILELQAERDRLQLYTGYQFNRLNQADVSLLGKAHEHTEDFDPETSMIQMAPIWVRDRWLKAIKNPDVNVNLRESGVLPEYLDVLNMTNAFAPEWKEIMDRRHIVVVSHDRELASNPTVIDAIHRRRCNLIGMTVGQL